MGLLQEWLAEQPLGEFRASHLGTAPFALPSTARGAMAACDWSTLNHLLAARPADVLVVARSQLLDLPPPRSLRELHSLFARGIGIAVRAPERHCEALQQLCDAFASELPGEQRLIVFATPAATHGFGWHYDAEDVFIVQTAGDKEYYFRPNTIDPHPKRGVQPDFSTYARETTPLSSCRLLPGDFLYLPRGYWHMARAHADALSISLGVFPKSA